MSATVRAKKTKSVGNRKIVQPQLLAIILVTQRRHGESLLEAAAHFTGDTPDNVAMIALLGNESRSDIDSKLRREIAQFNGGGVLLLCDLFGSTHASIAGEIAVECEQVACVSGLNLAMLMESYTVRKLSPAAAAVRVTKAGKQGVVQNGASTPAKKSVKQIGKSNKIKRDKKS